MKLIENEADIELLVNSFYDKVLHDKMLSPFFNHVAKSHWDQHLRVMNCFWNNLLFYTGGYFGNPLHTHQALHRFKTLEPKHFERWLSLFNTTIDELFKGEKAELAKSRAYAIATVMQIKVLPKEDKQIDEKIY
jgi:hemoglobin